VEKTKTGYPTTPIVAKGELPNPFIMPGGNAAISSAGDWPACARAWRDLIIDLEYGGMPPKPDAIEVETLCHNAVGRFRGAPRDWTYRVSCHGDRHALAA
jgi:hypothetical protein